MIWILLKEQIGYNLIESKKTIIAWLNVCINELLDGEIALALK